MKKADVGAVPATSPSAEIEGTPGPGGEIHQGPAEGGLSMTTNQGTVIGDDQSSLKVGARGPTLLEDHLLREKITHFDHERIPERVVHARGFGVHGVFQSYADHSHLTRAAFLTQPDVETPVFVRFSTVAGAKGSKDTARDVRGFAVKFYTTEGVFDLVGNNIPVFFIQDALKFPDLIHSAKEEPDRGFPQAATAHDTFWDFVSLTPESMHMLMWAMSDRAIPWSFRTMEGFGVHTFKMVNANGDVTFVKFHWRPAKGAFSMVWDEAVKLGGADPDFHRRDLWNAIEAGMYPEFELCVQAFDQATADGFDFDILDASKIIPEEEVPLTRLGKMTLNRNVDNFFAETEQVAFCPSHVVPGIDFTDDPLLQGRLFSYLDTQLKRLGGPNFHEIEINRPKCPWHNLQQDGHMRMRVPKGRVLYEPNSLDPTGPREDAARGFSTAPQQVTGTKQRIRPESFADHYSQARQFWISMTPPEQLHIVKAFAFELGMCKEVAIRQRMLGHLDIIHSDLGQQVAEALGMVGQGITIKPAVPPREDLSPSDALSLIKKAPQTLFGRRIGALVTDGVDDGLLKTLREHLEAEEAQLLIVAPKAGGVRSAGGDQIPADYAIQGGPSILFDAVVLAPSAEGVEELLNEPAAVDFVRDAYNHLKVIGYARPADALLLPAVKRADDRGAKVKEPGIVPVSEGDVQSFIHAVKMHRIWEREKGGEKAKEERTSPRKKPR